MRSLRLPLLALALASFVTLAGCDSAEERAEEHYQNSLALLADGDVDRALVELRNVFKLNGLHREARLTYAEVMRDRGDLQEAYSHYLLLSEQYPDDPLPRKWLFRIALLGNDFEEAKKHGRRAVAVAPDDPEVQAIGAILDYQSAMRDGNSSARREAAERLAEISLNVDDAQLYLPTLIDNDFRDNDLRASLEKIDRMLASDARLEQWQQLKLRILTELGDVEATKEQLETMVSLFPDQTEYPIALVRWYMSQDDRDGAEAFLRDWVDAAENAQKSDRQKHLVAFLAETAGPDAAIDELDRLIAEGDAADTFRAMRAGLLFDRGDRDAAIAQMEAIVDGGGDGAAPTGDLDIKVNLARMLVAVGRVDDARTRIDEVLARDSGHAGALKLHSGWLIEEDRADDAIVELRSALSRSPEDPEIMSLIAEAHIRNGSRDLAGEMLSLAVEASKGAPSHTIAYARYLMADRAYAPAENILSKSLRANPADTDLLALIGRLYVETSDWKRAEQIEARLRGLETETATTTADALRFERLQGQQRGEEALRFLTELAASEKGNSAAEIAVVRTHMENGNYADAEAFIDAQLAEDRQKPVMRMLRAALYSRTNRGDEAERILRRLVDEDPTREIVWRMLYETKRRLGEDDEATAILADALDALPNAPDLLWAMAGEKERDGDYDGAIEIYQGLYDRLPNSPIVANNLASLLSTHRDDTATLDRAYTIARRLRGSDVPAFQDTYGWIAYLRGQTEDAIAHLEPAAAAMPNEAIVRYRLGMAYAAADRPADAIESLKTAIDLAGEDASEDTFDRAHTELARLEAQLAEEESGN